MSAVQPPSHFFPFSPPSRPPVAPSEKGAAVRPPLQPFDGVDQCPDIEALKGKAIEALGVLKEEFAEGGLDKPNQ